MKHLGWLLILVLSACATQSPAKIANFGVLEVRFDGANSSASMFAGLKPQGLIAETGLQFTRIANSTFDVGNSRYIYATFSIQNTTGQTFENLTLYAYHQSANNIGGTAIKNIVNFHGDAITAPSVVQGVLPTHKHILGGNQNLTTDPDNADMQGFLPAEAAAIKNQAVQNGTISSSDDVLEYGYVARSGNSRTIAATGGTVTIALRFAKDSDPGLVPQSFTMTFLLSSQSQTRVTRDVVDDSSSALQSRAPANAKAFLIGTDDSSLTNRTFTPNLRIAATPNFLLEPVLTSAVLGTVDLVWDTTNTSPITDSSGLWTFTPATYSDIDLTSAGFRYLAATFRVDYRGATSQSQVGLRAINRMGNLAGSAVYDVRAFPNATYPAGEPLTDEIIAKSIVPHHVMQLGFSSVQPDPQSTAFMAYRPSETFTLGGGESALDYGFAMKSCQSSCSTSSFVGTFVAGSLGLAFISVRIPRNFTVPDPNNPPATRVVKPYKFKLSFAITSDSALRVSRGLLETTTSAEARGMGLGTAAAPAQLMLLGSDAETSSAVGVYPIRLPSIRIASGTTVP